FVYGIDKRPHILLLRSFQDDQIEIPVKRSYDQVIYGLSARDRRLEEIVVDVAYRYGPVGALQDPQVRLRPLGAARDLSANSDWKLYVGGAIARSAAIIVMGGKSPSFGWKFSIIRELGRLPNRVLVFPPREAFDADRDFDWEISSIRDGFLPNTA